MKRGNTSSIFSKPLAASQNSRQGRTFESYVSDAMLRAAVERQFEIVGEALAQLRKLEPETCAAISDASRIIAFRNILIHGYADVDDRLVWSVVETKLPTLIDEVARLTAAGGG